MSEQLPHPVRLFVALSAVLASPGPGRTARTGLRAFTDSAVAADRAGIDALVVRRSDPAGRATVEPAGVLAVVAARTVALGLVAEASPAYGEPARLAREIATLGLVSEGRAGLLLDPVPTPAERRNGFPAGPGTGPASAEDYLRRFRESFDGAGEQPLVLASWTPAADTGADCHVAAHDGGFTPRLTPVTLPATPGTSPEDTAALLERTVLTHRPEGLVLDFPSGPSSLEAFARVTLPLLRERGVLPPRAGRVRRTLRSRLGLASAYDATTAVR